VIDRQLDRLGFFGQSEFAEVSEAFAFTYLAQYCDTPPSARCIESYKRAYDFDEISFIPSMPGGPPGGLVAIWRGAYRPKVMVAFRGISSWSQLVPLRTGPTAVAYESQPGMVYAPFVANAAALQAALAGNALWTEAWGTRGMPICFAGHSMGGAMADLLADHYQRASFSKVIRCVKFGTPNFASGDFCDRRVRIRKTYNVYTWADPIGYMPTAGVTRSTIIGVTPSVSVFLFAGQRATESPKLFVDFQGNMAEQFTYSLTSVLADAARLSIFPGGRGNIWWFHLMNTYRYCMLSRAVRNNHPDRWRLVYLEHPDENGWAKSFNLNLDDWASLQTTTPGSPPDASVGLNEHELRVMETVRMREMIDESQGGGSSVGDSWGEEDTGGTSAGGEWGTPSTIPFRTRRYPPRRSIVPLP